MATSPLLVAQPAVLQGCGRSRGRLANVLPPLRSHQRHDHNSAPPPWRREEELFLVFLTLLHLAVTQQQTGSDVEAEEMMSLCSNVVVASVTLS